MALMLRAVAVIQWYNQKEAMKQFGAKRKEIISKYGLNFVTQVYEEGIASNRIEKDTVKKYLGFV